MSEGMTAEIVASVAEIAEHPAARAWAAVGGGGVVRSIARLAKEHHCLVYRLDTGPEPSQSVIAKWGDREFHFNIHKKFQKEILLWAALPSLAIYGEVVGRSERPVGMTIDDRGYQLP